MRKINLIITVVLLFPAFLSGSISIILACIETPLFIMLRPGYKLSKDKAWIEVVTVSSTLWKFYMWYCRNYVDNVAF